MKPFILALLSMQTLVAAEEIDVAKISEAMGHMIGKNLQSLGLPLDVDAVVQGMKNACEGKEAPMREEDCVEALSFLQEENFADLAEANLELANQFLIENGQDPSIVSLDGGKVQYRVDKEGAGERVKAYSRPIVRYTVRSLSGDIVAVTDSDEILSDPLPGLAHGIVGMAEGEVRTIFVHPDLAYGKYGLTEPNALLLFEVEVVQADILPSPDGDQVTQREDVVES